MVVYVVPRMDEQAHADAQRLEGYNVRVVVLEHDQVRFTVRHVVRMLCNADCTALVLPDDYHRHTERIEDVKCCAYRMGLDVMPLGRYLMNAKPRPAAAAAAPPTQQPAVAGNSLNPINP